MKPSSRIRRESTSWLALSAALGALMQSTLPLPAADEPKGPRPNQPPEQMFQRMDTNRDGKVSREEYENAMRFAPRFRDNPQQAQVIFRQLDTDGDGSLSVQEFGRVAAMAGRGPGGGTPEQRAQDGFRLLDTNNDRKLSRQEFARMADLNPQLKENPERIDQMFSLLDKNLDAQIDAEEFKAVSELQRQAAMMERFNPTPAVEKIAKTPEKPLTAAETEFFEKKIRPVLSSKCYECHSTESGKAKGSLVLDTKSGIRQGGDKGHAVIPGDVEGSLLIKAIRYHDKDMQMPPEKKGGQLAAAVIADFEQWVKMGAPDPREGKVVAKNLDLEKGREHWAFQLPKKAAAPAVKDKAWPHNDVDRQVLATLEAKGLKPVGDADPTTFIRRLYFDLVGLPPTPAEAEDFVKKCAAAADKKSGPLPQSVVAATVDKLLASPQFGERWGRHWLDVARYGESSGKEVNITYPHAWRYRDYVIDAFNTDKPYDRFLKEQLAGDLMTAPNSTDKALQEIATGFLAIGPKSHNTREARQFLLDVADEQIDTLSQGMLGLTVACARCHDHKFDPIPTQDYYALAGIFLSTETRYGTARFIQNNQPSALVRLPDDAYVNDAEPMSAQESAIIRRQLENAKKSRDEILAAARANGGQAALMGDIRLIRDNTQISIFEQMLGRQDTNGQNMRLAMGVQDRLSPQDTRILVRGEMDKASDTVPRGFVQVVNTGKSMPTIQKGSGRLELAEWIASPENPLTARVMVNRVWLHLFGRGIVASPNNFGVTGQAPTHPALLDQLSISFVENGWSVKKLIRELVLSHTYQLAATHNVAAHAVDPENTLYWRMSPRRLDAEAIRDAMLAAAGRLTLTPPKGSEIAKYEGPVNVLQRFGATQREHNYRSVYLPIVRDQVPEALAVFDFAEPSLVVGEREETSVPSQALYLLNNANVQRLSEAMADRLLKDAAAGPDRAKLAFQLTFGRPPTATELKSSSEFFSRFATVGTSIERSADNRTALVAFCQALLGSAEFRYLY